MKLETNKKKELKMEQLNELLPVVENGENKAVNARDLHRYLCLGKDFSSWIKEMVAKYGFRENEDYEKLVPEKGELDFTGVTAIEYILTIDMAKELAMVQKNEKGRQARKYFIEVERMARELVYRPQPIGLSAEQVIAIGTSMKVLEEKVEEQERSLKHGYKSVIGKKEKQLKIIKEATGITKQGKLGAMVREIYEERNHLRVENSNLKAELYEIKVVNPGKVDTLIEEVSVEALLSEIEAMENVEGIDISNFL